MIDRGGHSWWSVRGGRAHPRCPRNRAGEAAGEHIVRVSPTGMTDRLPADLLPAGPTAATFALVLGAATMLGGYLGSRTATTREAASSASPSSWWSPR